MSDYLKINSDDNVAIALKNLPAGAEVCNVKIRNDIPFAHKFALADIKANDNVIKYGCPIGHATQNISAGEHIHSHNLATNLSSINDYQFTKSIDYSVKSSQITFNAYKRNNGKVGIRNEIWIIPTVGCVNKTAQQLEKIANSVLPQDKFDGVVAYTHPYGCSQSEQDQDYTAKVLAGLINHPNAGAVLVLSLGCENLNLNVLKTYLGNYDESRVKFLVAQDVNDELETGTELIKQLYDIVKLDERQPVGIDNLVVGFKCGGSDALSGITANPLCGKISNALTSYGATAVLTEVPEMFGAEHILMNRCSSKTVFDKTVSMINRYKKYFFDHSVPCYDNPSPGNKAGGITTLEEKSLGCVQKGGTSVVTDVLDYAQSSTQKGLNLLYGPGNDIVSTTNLTACGAHIILFTTGRGTSLGAPVPTLKISSNTNLAKRKSNWIDFDGGSLLDEDSSLDLLADSLFDLLIKTANGSKTKNEINGYRDIAIFKDGVIM